MAGSLEVTDPSDWQTTLLPTFTSLDSCLRCQVCKEYFNTALITSCAHSFCSLCIRRCIAADGKCPTCRANEQESKLRKNVSLQEAADAFVAARADAMKVVSEGCRPEQQHELHATDGIRVKRKLDRISSEGEQEDFGQRRSQRRKQNAILQEEVLVVDSDENDASYDPSDGLVACPICGKRMKEQQINSHLDNARCGESSPQPKISKSSRSRGPGTVNIRAGLHDYPQSILERLPQLNYSILKEAALKKKLQDLGIPAWGMKALLARRHLEWINIWNANCDANNPRPKSALLRELDLWERTQGGLAPSTGQQNTVMRKDFDGDGWASKHKDDFKQLIANARKVKDEAKEPREAPKDNITPDPLPGYANYTPDPKLDANTSTPADLESMRTSDVIAQLPSHSPTPDGEAQQQQRSMLHHKHAEPRVPPNSTIQPGNSAPSRYTVLK